MIGFGMVGRVHSKALAGLGVQLEGVVCSSPASGERAAAELGVRAYPTAATLFADECINVVHICTPHPLHASLAGEALAAGKHVVCEKPLAVDRNEARELAAAADAAGVVHAVCYDLRFAPGVSELRRAVAMGQLGEVHLANGVFHLDEVRILAPNHWMLDTSRGGPSLTLADIGVHWWDLLEFVTRQRIAAAIASTRSVRAGGLDDSAAIGLRMTGGIQAMASLSQAVGMPGQLTLQVAGTGGARAWVGAEGLPAGEVAAAKQETFNALMGAIYADIILGRRSETRTLTGSRCSVPCSNQFALGLGARFAAKRPTLSAG